MRALVSIVLAGLTSLNGLDRDESSGGSRYLIIIPVASLLNFLFDNRFCGDVGAMFGWLVGWLFGWLVGWLVGWCHVCGERVESEPACQSRHQGTNHTTNQCSTDGNSSLLVQRAPKYKPHK